MQFRGLVHVSAGGAIPVEAAGADRQDAEIRELWEGMDTAVSREGVETSEYAEDYVRYLRMVYLSSVDLEISDLCTIAPIPSFPCASWLAGQPDGMLYAESNGRFPAITAFAPWGHRLEILSEADDGFEDRFHGGDLWPLGLYETSLIYGSGTFELSEYDQGFTLRYGDLHREYVLFPRDANSDADGTYNLDEVPPLTDRVYSDEGIEILGGSFYFAGTDGERIGVVFEHHEPTCAYDRELFVFSLRDGSVQSCVASASGRSFALTATSESYEPLDDIKLPPSGWLYTEPCISFGYFGAEFGGADTDWSALAELVLQPTSIPR